METPTVILQKLLLGLLFAIAALYILRDGQSSGDRDYLRGRIILDNRLHLEFSSVSGRPAGDGVTRTCTPQHPHSRTLVWHLHAGVAGVDAGGAGA